MPRLVPCLLLLATSALAAEPPMPLRPVHAYSIVARRESWAWPSSPTGSPWGPW
jgi:hypothetical protein